MDLFPRSAGAADGPNLAKGIAATTGLTMGYYDGNTVTAVWNYAQRYAMSDRASGLRLDLRRSAPSTSFPGRPTAQ